MSITLRDIAKALNLSTSTVSKALRDSYEIGTATKIKVNAYAKEVGYQPNTLAKGLKEGKSRSIGVVVCSIYNTFVSQMVDAIDQLCNSRGYSILLMQSKESHNQENKCIDLLNARGIDGLLISPAYDTPNIDHLKKYIDSGLPIVLFDRLIDDLQTQKVSSNNLLGAYKATEHLIQNGYKKIAVLHSRTELSITVERIAGYKKALKANGIAFNDRYLKPCAYQNAQLLSDSVVHALKDLIQLENPPDAILAMTDQITISTIKAIQKLGLKIPGDIALIGFTNTELADSLNPPLSTVYQPAKAIGEAAATKLLDYIEGKEPFTPEPIKLDVEIIARSSSAPK